MPPPSADSRFATTQWELIRQAQGADSGGAREAFAELCRLNWYPVYAYFRRKTGSPEQAEDLTQGLFAHLIEGDALATVDPARGRFRAFLMACCDHFLFNERARSSAAKRGGGRALLSIDSRDAETRYRLEPTDHLTPEKLFTRQWALAVLDATLRDLEWEYEAAGNAALFARLKPTLTSGDGPRYAEVATELEMSESAVKKAAQRLRERYGEALRLRISATLAEPEQIDDEIRGLFEALAGD